MMTLIDRLAVAATILMLFCVSSRAEELIGVPRIVDGDTVAINGTKVRLQGIDAPETEQFCLDDKAQVAECGKGARDRLVEKSAGRSWTCQLQGHDRFGRGLGRCYVGGEDIQKWMVHNGLALAYKHYSHDYDSDEEAAREARAGLWSGAFVAPWDWRHRNKSTEILGAVSVPLNAQKVLLRPDAASATHSTAELPGGRSTSAAHGGCGSRGGPGYRLPSGKCASRRHKR